jgi:hypothetical protein
MRTGTLRRLLAPSCPCQAQIASVRRARQGGEHLTGRATLNALRVSMDSARSATVLVDYGFSGGGLVGPDGSRLTTIKAHRHIQWQFELRRTGSDWVITRIGAAA